VLVRDERGWGIQNAIGRDGKGGRKGEAREAWGMKESNEGGKGERGREDDRGSGEWVGEKGVSRE